MLLLLRREVTTHNKQAPSLSPSLLLDLQLVLVKWPSRTILLAVEHSTPTPVWYEDKCLTQPKHPRAHQLASILTSTSSEGRTKIAAIVSPHPECEWRQIECTLM